MTNVINTAANSAVTSNIHAPSLNQSDDILPSLSSLSFNVTSSSEHDSGSSPGIARGNASNDDTIVSLSETNLSTLNPILSSSSIEPKDSNLNTVENNAELLSVLPPASNSTNGSATSPSLNVAQVSLSSYDYGTNPDDNSVATVWSNVDDGSNHNILSNGFKSSPNYQNSVSNLINNTNLSGNLQQSQNRRAITASHGCFQPALPPNNCIPPGRGNAIPIQHPSQNHHHNMHKNNMHESHQLPHSHHHLGYQQPQNHDTRDQQYQDIHRHQQKPSGYNSNYPVWSNPSGAVAWSCGSNQPQHPQQHPHQQMQPWNRGRSVPNLNPISNNLPNNRKPTSPNPGMSMSAFVPTQSSCGMSSPLKYRRSTSFPGKGQNLQQGNLDLSAQGQNNIAHTSLDVNALDDAREQFMQYQVTKSS